MERVYQNYIEPYGTKIMYCVLNEGIRDLGADSLPPTVG